VPVTVAATYTFSHSVSNVATTAVGHPLDFDYDLGYDAEDRPHRAQVTAQWQQPDRSFLQPHPMTNFFLTGWTVTTKILAQSGSPVNVSISRPAVVYVDAAGNVFDDFGEGLAPLLNIPGGAIGAADRPDLLPGVSPYLDEDRRVLNPAAFATPAPGVLGNLRRGEIRGPRLVSVDLFLSRTLKFQEPSLVWFEFTTEILNLFNHANFKNPSASLPSALGMEPRRPASARSRAPWLRGPSPLC
jgi:hypothetical protein